MWCVVYAKKPYMDCLTYNNIDVYSKGEYMFYEKIELFVNVLKKFDIYIYIYCLRNRNQYVML